MHPTTKIPTIIRQKLSAFSALESDFVASFQFLQALQGQKRFDALTVNDAVRYLHACYLCESKDRLLSVTRTIPRYHGEEALHLLRQWQMGDSTPIIAFLHNQLDSQPFGDLTRQWQVAQDSADTALVQRLAHGREVLLNRAINLLRLFAAIFALNQADLLTAVQASCVEYGHEPALIAADLAALQTAPYAYHLHPLLAQRNMQVMNALGIATLMIPNDLPGERIWHVSESQEFKAPFADFLIPDYVEITL